MKLIIVLAGLLLCAAPLLAETYSWVDEKGTFNFTEDYSRVPKKYRAKVVKRGDLGAAPVSKDTAAPTAGFRVAPPAAAKDAAAGRAGSPAGSFGGQSYDQWKQEFGEREAALRVVKKRIDEIDALLKQKPVNREQTQSLISERNRAAEQFTEMRKEYDQHAEKARKAGIPVDISPQP